MYAEMRSVIGPARWQMVSFLVQGTGKIRGEAMKIAISITEGEFAILCGILKILAVIIAMQVI